MNQSGMSKKSPTKGSPLSNKPKKRFGAKSNTVAFSIRFRGFNHTNFEVYEYNKTLNGILSEGYTYPIRKFVEGEPADNIPLLEEHGFFAVVYQREGLTSNRRLLGGDAWGRFFVCRAVPGGVLSSVSTRTEGAEALRATVMDANYSRYPPKHIDLIDFTDDGPVQAYLMDADILRILPQIVDESVMNRKFAGDYPDLAAILFPGPTYPPEAVRMLGYGEPNPTNNETRNSAPGFNPPPPHGGNGGNAEDGNDGADEEGDDAKKTDVGENNDMEESDEKLPAKQASEKGTDIPPAGEETGMDEEDEQASDEEENKQGKEGSTKRKTRSRK